MTEKSNSTIKVEVRKKIQLVHVDALETITKSLAFLELTLRNQDRLRVAIKKALTAERLFHEKKFNSLSSLYTDKSNECIDLQKRVYELQTQLSTSQKAKQ